MAQPSFGHDIPESALKDWLSQFAVEDTWPINRLLEWFRYYDSNALEKILVRAHNIVLAKYKTPPDRIWFIPTGYVARGGSAVAHLYRTANAVKEVRFITRDDLQRLVLKDDLVIFLDDFVGSGEYGRLLWKTVSSSFTSANQPAAWVLICAIGYSEGIDRIRKETGFDVFAGEELPTAAQPFTNSSRIFPDPQERARALEIVGRYGGRLEPSMPLGQGGIGGLVGFFFGSPDATLPIFWSMSAGWKPLLPSVRTAEADSDFGAARMSSRSKADQQVHAEQASVAELHRLSSYDVPREVTNRILEEFKTTANFIVLFDVARQIGLSAGVLARIPDLVHNLAHATHEKESVCTAIAICDPTSLARAGLDPFVAPPHDATFDDDLVLALAEYVDGFQGAVVVGVDGRLLGNVMYPRGLKAKNHYPPLPQRYGPGLSMTITTKGLLFLFAGNGHITVFYNGSRILRHRNAGWYNDEFSEQSIGELERAHDLGKGILGHVLRLAFEIAEQSYGAIFMVGDEQTVRRMCDPPAPNAPTWRPISVTKDDFREAVFLARQDGACIVTSDGTIVAGMMMLRPPAQEEADTTLAMGARHKSAAKMSKVTKALAVVVSVSGRISIFSRGERRYTIVS